MTQSAQYPLQIGRADVPFEEELKIMMVSCKGKLCLRPKDMVPRLVTEEEDFSQEELEKEETRTFFSYS